MPRQSVHNESGSHMRVEGDVQVQALDPSDRLARAGSIGPAAVERSSAGAQAGARPARGLLRYLLIAAGVVCVGVGLVGVWVPGLPTTVFMILALAAFARSSQRLHAWLINHPRFGAALRDWMAHRVIPRKVKAIAVTMMAVSLVILLLLGVNWVYLAISATAMIIGALYVISQPSQAGMK